VLGTEYGGQPYSTFVSNVTVKDLLQHTSGGWNNAYPGDIVYTNPTFTPAQLITWALTNKPLANAPGTTYQYSNFGYLVLARIIEKSSGKTCEEYIKNDIFKLIGIRDIELAGNTLAERKNNEVVYYGQGGEPAFVYTDPLRRNDGPSAWIASPTDLLRFITAIDSLPSRPDILSNATLTIMRTPSALNQNYASGLNIENHVDAGGSLWYHYGSIPGAQSVFLRMSNGMCAAFTANSRSKINNGLNIMGQLIAGILIDPSTTWQDIDMFSK